jgi:internalin A
MIIKRNISIIIITVLTVWVLAGCSGNGGESEYKAEATIAATITATTEAEITSETTPGYIYIGGNEFNTDLTELDLSWIGLADEDIIDLKYMTNLSHLNLFGNQISDITPLSELVNLTYLNLSMDFSLAHEMYNNKIVDLTPLSNLINLTELDLGGNFDINDITPLSNLTNLTVLNLNMMSYINSWEGGQISDITPLSNLIDLTDLNLEGNKVSDITPLSNMLNLTNLYLHDNRINDIAPLSNLSNLTNLYLGDNEISDITPLSNLSNIIVLRLDGNQISDLKPLINLRNLTDINFNGNPVTDGAKNQYGELQGGVYGFKPSNPIPGCFIVSVTPVIDPATGVESTDITQNVFKTSGRIRESISEDGILIPVADPNHATFVLIIDFQYGPLTKGEFTDGTTFWEYNATKNAELLNMITGESIKLNRSLIIEGVAYSRYYDQSYVSSIAGKTVYAQPIIIKPSNFDGYLEFIGGN